jgi:hypothetical protein
MLVRSFDQIVLPDLGDISRFDRGLVERRDAAAPPARLAVVAFADQEPVALGREVRDHAGATTSLDENTTPPTISALGWRHAGVRRIEEGQIRYRRMSSAKPDIVPPGNAVLREHHGGILSQQWLQAFREAGKAVAFIVQMTASCGPMRAGSLDALTFA